jgi:glutathione S-transferase
VIGADVKLESHDFGQIHQSEWAQKQPFNQMPYLVDNTSGFEVFESRAIAKYLAVKAGSDLVPAQSDAEAYARFEQGCSIEQSNFDPAASGLAFELVFSKMFGLECVPESAG